MSADQYWWRRAAMNGIGVGPRGTGSGLGSPSSVRVRARMRPQVRGERKMPRRLSAACTRNSPSSGFSRSSVTVAIARSVSLVAGRCGARDLSGIPANSSSDQRCSVACTVCRLVSKYAAMDLAFQPSTCGRTMANRRWVGSLIAW